MFARHVAGCLHVVGRWMLGAYIPVLIACMLFVACRSSSSACVLTWEAAPAVRAASVLVDGVSGFAVVCDCLRLFVVVTVVVVCSCFCW